MAKSSMVRIYRDDRRGLDTSRYAVIYPRQSSKEQVDQNVYSLERQMMLKERAARDGFPEELILVVDDDLGMSGRSIDTRPGFSRALRLLEQGQVAALYVEDLTRLSRDERTIDQMIIADACERAGAMIFMGGSWYDMRDSGQRQSYKYQAVGGSEYWKAHVQKLYHTKRQKAQSGKAVGPIPRGYRVHRVEGSVRAARLNPEADTLTIHEPEAAIIRAVAAAVLNEGGFRPAMRKLLPLYWPDGTPLNWRTAWAILKSPTMRGTYKWGDVVIENNHPAIIPPEDGAAIDAIFESNRASRRRPGDAPNSAMLSGLLWCPECGVKIYTNGSHKRPYYCCLSYTAREMSHKTHFTAKAHAVEALVVAALWRRLDGGLLEAIAATLRATEAKRAAIVDLGEANRAAIQRRIDGLARRLANPDLEPAAEKVLIAALNQATAELEAITPAPIGRSAAIACELAELEELRARPDFLATLPATWGDEPMEWRRAFLRRLIERVDLVRESRIRVRMVIRWRDGSTDAATVQTQGAVTPEELEAVRALWNDPARPALDWNPWIRARLSEAGYDRSPSGIYRLIDRVRAGDR